MYRDRRHAGEVLSDHLRRLGLAAPVVLALPRGGLPVAEAVASALDAPLDVILVRKLGVPYHAELAWGAIGEDGIRVVNDDVLRTVQASPAELVAVELAERKALETRIVRYREHRAAIPLADRTVVIVDDGLATGASMNAACQVARAKGASRVVAAVPVAPPGWDRGLADVADQAVCPLTPKRFRAVGAWYEDFRPTSDDEALACLTRNTATR